MSKVVYKVLFSHWVSGSDKNTGKYLGIKQSYTMQKRSPIYSEYSNQEMKIIFTKFIISVILMCCYHISEKPY